MGVAVGFGLLVAALLAPVGRGQIHARPAEHFLEQVKAECHYFNGTQRVRFLSRDIYGRQEIVRFDSDRGVFEAITPLGEPDARYWNSRKDFLEDKRRAVDYFCRPNYGIYEPFASGRKIQPQVKIVLSESSVPPNALLICNVGRFWPSKINITWFRNGEEENETRVFTTDLTRNGDWTFQVAVMLETRPERGDVYACRVEHGSFPEPVSVQWEAQSKSARNKIWTGAVGIVTGLVFVATSISVYVRNKKALMS